MFLELEVGGNLCLPCEWGGFPIPCVPAGAMYPQGKVRSCDMQCGHQQMLTKASECTDVSGDITADSCYAKGSTDGAKCMFTSYITEARVKKSMCGPCDVDGIGVVSPYVVGNAGPEDRSTVLAALSQCEDGATAPEAPCGKDPSCPDAGKPARLVTPAPLASLGMIPEPGSPAYVAVPVMEPFGTAEYTEAAAVAARAAGWPAGAVLPPDAKLESPGPPPIQGPPPPQDVQLVYGAAPPPGIAWHPGLWPTFPPPMAMPGAANAGAGAAMVGGPPVPATLAQLRGVLRHNA